MANAHPVGGFKKGQSGNPSGRPKREWNWTDELIKAANELETKTGKPFRELVAKRIIVDAASGNTQAAREVFNRIDGMPKQEIAQDVSGAIEIIITEDKQSVGQGKDE